MIRVNDQGYTEVQPQEVCPTETSDNNHKAQILVELAQVLGRPHAAGHTWRAGPWRYKLGPIDWKVTVVLLSLCLLLRGLG